MHADDVIAHHLHVKPGACQRLAADIFVETPLYRAKNTCHPVYINRTSYMRIFGCATAPTWDEMAQTLTALFSTTIEPEHGTGEVVATAYVDRQSDPLDLSLSGNLGSGRAYYIGDCFNIKGERTPLATAQKKQFSDGFLEMERALWETLVACGLQGSITNGLNDVLAVIDMNDTCVVGWRDHPVKRAKVIRIDNGCLDRVTHLFHAPRPLNATALHDVARSYGRLEADKFTARIAHGTWSPGNISLEGHLIDFDTVCATKGRAPTYSSTRWYHQNRFGFEHGGQATILRALAADTRINAEGVSANALCDTMSDTLQTATALNFIALMGFDDPQMLYAAHKDEIDAVCTLWQEIARKGYACGGAYILKDTRANHVHVCDTAAFMAAYPLLLRHDIFDTTQALQLMIDDDMGDDLLQQGSTAIPLTDIEQQHQDAVDAVIGTHIVNADTRELVTFAALGFVRKYERLFKTLLATSRADLARIEAQALTRNEDRRTLFPALTATFRLAENKDGLSALHLDAIMNALVESCRRPHISTDSLVWGMQVFKQGVFAVHLDGKGSCRLAFKPHLNTPQAIEIEWNNQQFTLDSTGRSEHFDTDILLPELGRMGGLQPTPIQIYSQNEHIALDPL